MPKYALVDRHSGLVANLVEAPANWTPAGDLDKRPVTPGLRIGELYASNNGDGDAPADELGAASRRQAALARLRAGQAAALAEGAPLEDGRRIAVDAASLGKLAAMATTASLALIGAAPWPENYAQGWIATDNTLVPLPQPRDGIALFAKVDAWQSGLTHKARALKDDVLQGKPAAELPDWGDYAPKIERDARAKAKARAPKG